VFRLHRLLCIALVTLCTMPAAAQFTRDNAANKKIDEAINQHYVATDFEKAESVLLGTINACGDKCSPAVFAKAWMYIGIIRGSGRNNQAGAKEAFQKAVASDPSVKLDMVLATPETQATFDAVSGGGGGEAPAEPVEEVPAEPGEAAPAKAAAGGLECTPEVTEVETRRPIPVECGGDDEVTAMDLRYKPFGGSWKTIKMEKKGESFRATIPCDDTQVSGTVRMYVRAKNASGDEVDSWGSKGTPVEINLGETVAADPPAFDGEEAPERCAAAKECPPDFPGCDDKKGGGGRGDKDWGAECANSVECKSGLLCQGGTCETAPSCEGDGDCETGYCNAGKCDLPEGAGESSVAGPFKRHWVGLHVAQDFAVVGDSNVCDPNLGQSSASYSCFLEGTTDRPFVHTPYPLKDGIQTGTVLATTRILASYDFALFPYLTVGARLGYAFGGGPPAGQTAAADGTGSGGTPFLPIHAEARAQFWFLSLSNKMIRAYVGAGGGMAQVDGKVPVPEKDCTADALEGLPGNPNDPEQVRRDNAFEACRTAAANFNWAALPDVKVDAWKKMGQGFISGNVGGMFGFAGNMGAVLNVNVMYMLPAAGLVIEPSLGITMGL
jgi:hypothetical protein